MKKSLVILLIGIAIADFLAGIDSTAITVALPKIASGLHLTSSSSSLLQIFYTLTTILVLIPVGKLGDQRGHKRNFLLGLGLFGTVSLLLTLTGSFSGILLLRAFQGVAAGILYTAGGALVAHHWKNTELPFGVTAGFFSLGMLVGPLAGGILSDLSTPTLEGWHIIFLINVPLSLLSFFFVKKYAKETTIITTKQPFDALGLLLLSLFLACLSLLLLQSSYRYELLILVALSFFAFVWQENRRSNPLVSLQIFQEQTFASISVFTFFFMFILLAFSFINTYYLQDVLGKSATQAGLYILPISLGMGIFSIISGTIRNWKLSCIISSLLLLTGLCVLTQVSPEQPYFSGLFWGYFLISAGAGFMFTNTFAAALGSVSSLYSGIAAGYINTVQQIGGLAGVAFAGGQAVTKDYQILYVYLTLVATLTLLASLFIRNQRKS